MKRGINSVLILLLFLSLFSLRWVYPSADPPKNLTWSAGIFFDESTYSQNARNRILYGKWKLDEHNPMVYTPLYTYLQYLVFSIFGVGFVQLRLISLISSCLTLMFSYFLMKEGFGKKEAVLTVIVLGIDYPFIMYNRVGLCENLMILFMVLTLFFWQRALRRGNIYFFLSGFACFTTCIIKSISIYFMVATMFSLLYFLLNKYRGKENSLRKMSLPLLSFLGGVFLVAGVWFITFFLPNLSEISRTGSQVLTLVSPSSVKAAWNNILHQPFFITFKWTPIILIGGYIYALFIINSLLKRERINHIEFFALCWLLIGIIFLSFFSYRPPRYYLPLVLPLSIFASLALVRLRNIRPIEKLRKKLISYSVLFFGSVIILSGYIFQFTHKYLPPITLFQEKWSFALIGSIMILLSCIFFPRILKGKVAIFNKITFLLFSILIIGSIIINGRSYYKWVSSREYVLPSISQELGERLDNAYIAGKGSVFASMGNKHQSLYVAPGGFNYENTFKKFKITHLFLTPYVGEPKWYEKEYPEIMKRARILKAYRIRNQKFLLYALNVKRIQIADIQPGKAVYELNSPITVRVRVKNLDPKVRQLASVWLFLNKMGEIGHPINKVNLWGIELIALNPLEQEEIIFQDKTPSDPGNYELVVGIVHKNSNFEAEFMPRRIGQVRNDKEAIYESAVYGSINEHPDYLVFGPYKEFPAGKYKAGFRLKIEDNSSNTQVALLDVCGNKGTKIVTKRMLQGINFKDRDLYQYFSLPFSLENSEKLEFRVFTYSKTGTWVDNVVILNLNKNSLTDFDNLEKYPGEIKITKKMGR